MHLITAQHRRHRGLGKQAGDRRIAHVQAAGEGAEGRQDGAAAVGDEAGSAHAPAIGGDPGGWVKGNRSRLGDWNMNPTSP